MHGAAGRGMAWGWGTPWEHSHGRASVTSNGQALLGPHQSLVGDSCCQKNESW